MKNYKIVVSKWLQRFTFIRKSESEIELREELHKEGFSIMSIEIMDNIEVSWNKYFFEIFKDWEIKTWTISSPDIFKAYLKIKVELKYDLKYIYQDKETPIEEKKKIIHDLEEQFGLYRKSNIKEINIKEKEDEKKTKVVEEVSTQDFQMKKELEETYKIIDRVLIKMDFFIKLENNEYLNFEKKEKLKQIHQEIIKLKTSTNIFKLRQIWELWLVKVWEIELNILENKKSEELRKLLKETNILLKQVWSKKNFIEKEKDLWYITKTLFNNFKENLELDKKIKKEHVVIDKKSSNYLKTESLYNKYSQKLKEINKEISKNILIYLIPTKENIKKQEYFALRKKVINQNLTILKAKMSWWMFSYVKVVKWYKYFISKLIDFLNLFNFPIFLVSSVYSITFLIFNILGKFWIIIDLNFKWLFFFVYLLIFYIFTKSTKWFLSLVFNFVIFMFLVIFGVINF